MKTLARVDAAAAALFLGFFAPSIGAGLARDPAAALGEPAPKIEFEAQSGAVRIGAVTVDPARREIRFRAQVNMDEGLLEYALVGERGKLRW